MKKIKHIHSFPSGEIIVGMEKFKDYIYIATEKGIYKIVNDELIPIEFVRENDIENHPST